MRELFLLDSVGASIALACIRLLGVFGGIAVGRSFAASWTSPVLMPLALLLMSVAVQFVIFAVLQVDLLSIDLFVIIAVLVSVAGVYGYRAKRTEQMCRQYPWLFAKASPVGWSDRG